MSARKIDHRTIATKKLLKSTLKNMVCEMDLGALTIKELTARAHMNRKTFYLHYASLDELFKSVGDDVAVTFEQLYRQQNSAAKSSDYHALICDFQRLIAMDQDFHRQIFCNDSYSPVFSYICDQIGAVLKSQLQQQLHSSNSEINITLTFLIHGFFAVFREYFLLNNDPELQNKAEQLIAHQFQTALQN